MSDLENKLDEKENSMVDVIKTTFLSLLIALFIRFFIVSIANVDGRSMQNTLMNNDKLVMEKISERFGKLKRGDIIAFDAPNNSGDIYVKRIIGIPGDTVELKKDGVYLNDKKLDEYYLKKGMVTLSEQKVKMNEKIVVTKDTFFVMGDNRTESMDGRSFGLIPQNSVIGHAVLRIYPFNKISIIK